MQSKCWVRWPLLGVLAVSLGAAESADKEQAKETLWSKTKGGLKGGLKAIPGVGSAASELLFGSEAAASLRIQEQILETNSSTLDQIREVARDALAVKEKIEEVNRLRRDAIRLGKRLQQTNYLRLLMSVGEGLLKVELNPGRYVPHTEYTRDFKYEVHMDLSSERGVLQQSGRLLRQTRKGLSLEKRSEGPERSERTVAAYAEALERASAHDRAVERHLAEQRLSLARYYEALAEGLLKANEELRALLEEEEAGMSTAEAVQAYQTISENTQQAAELKRKACALLEKLRR